MTRLFAGLVALFALGALPVLADGLEKSLRPVARATDILVQRPALLPTPDFAALLPVADATLAAVAPPRSHLTVSSSNAVAVPQIRPMARPQGLAKPEPTQAAFAVIRPLPRPFIPATAVAPKPAIAVPELAVVQASAVQAPVVQGLGASKRPQARPRGIEKIVRAAAIRVKPAPGGVVSKKGSICGDPSIKGQVIAPVVSRVRGCGIADAVKVTSVSGVALSTPATVECATAVALNKWVVNDLQPNMGKRPAVQLLIAGSYSCRPRNSVRGAKISEHGKGRAIDVAGYVLLDGTKLTVARDWRGKMGRAMKAAYKGGCGIFGTTLGPGSDGHHEDHMHFDVVRYRNGTYCR